MFDFNNFNKGTKYLEKGNLEKAAIFLRRELVINEFKECYLNLGNTYKQLGKFQDARECYEKALDVHTPFASGKFGEYDLAISNLGLYWYAMGDDNKAISLYEKALDLNPMLHDAVWNHSSASLRKLCSREEGDWAEAWKMYDYRFKRSNPVPIDRSVRLWDGISSGEVVCVLAEQGMGDKVMFGRYISGLYKFFKKIVVQCPVEMQCIFSAYETSRVAVGDYSVPICSLAKYFSGDVEWLGEKYPWLGSGGENIRVACCWSGSPTHQNDRNRSVTADMFQRLGQPGIELVTFGPGKRGIVGLETIPSWEATIRELQKCDLLISVDTSIVHVAGSMGVPTWMIQPSVETDFRWGNDSMGEDNIWYPSVKVIRNAGNWSRIFDRLKTRLACLKSPVTTFPEMK